MGRFMQIIEPNTLNTEISKMHKMDQLLLKTTEVIKNTLTTTEQVKFNRKSQRLLAIESLIKNDLIAMYTYVLAHCMDHEPNNLFFAKVQDLVELLAMEKTVYSTLSAKDRIEYLYEKFTD